MQPTCPPGLFDGAVVLTTHVKLNSKTVLHAVRSLKKADPTLAAVISSVGPCHLRVTGGRFEVLARAVIAQQISTAAASTIKRRVTKLMPDGRTLSARGIAALTDDQLQAAGVSSQKRSYLRDLSSRVLSDQLNLRRVARAGEEQAIAELTAVRGIGTWTAQMFLMFGLGHPDIFPVGDLGIRTAVACIYELPDRNDVAPLDVISQAWAPWRTVACWYLWRYLDGPAAG